MDQEQLQTLALSELTAQLESAREEIVRLRTELTQSRSAEKDHAEANVLAHREFERAHQEIKSLRDELRKEGG